MIESTRRRRIALSTATILLAAALFTLALLGGVATGSAAAANASNISQQAPMYNNSTQNVTGSYWFDDGNASLDSLGEMASRIVPAIIGTGSEDPSGTGYVGVLLLGLVFAGGTLASVMGIGIGPVGGSIVGLTLSYGLIEVGIAPSWAWPLVLFAIGILAAVAALRILNS